MPSRFRTPRRGLCAAVAVLLVACGGEPGPADSSSDTTDVPQPFDIAATRALPIVPASYTVHARGDVILLRTADGVWRSDDGGVTFATWTAERTVAILPLPDRGALQIRDLDPDEGHQLVLERLTPGGQAQALAVEPTWEDPEVRWVGGTLTAGEGRSYLQVFGVTDTTQADTRLFQVDADGSVTELALPDGAGPGAVWLVADLGPRIAVATATAEGTLFHVRRDDGGWHTPAGEAPLAPIDLVATHDGALVAVTVADGAAALVRLELDAGLDVATATATPATTAMSLARDADAGTLYAVSRAFIAPPSVAGRVIMRSKSAGRVWETLATSLEAGDALDPRVTVATTGLWTREAMFPTWRPHDQRGAPWRIAGLSRELGVQHLQAQGDEIWAVAWRFPLFGVLDGGTFLFRSADRGVTWHYSANPGLNVGCFALTPSFLFFGGLGDIAGAYFETRDRTGRRLIRNEHVVVRSRPAAAQLDIIACASSGGPSVVISQAGDGKTPSFVHGANFQHQATEGEAIEWGVWSLDGDLRVTALDGQGVGLEPIWAAGEELTVDVVGYQSLPVTAFFDDGEFVWTKDPFRNQLGARGASRRHGFLLVYPTGDVLLIGAAAGSVTGLDATDTNTPPIHDAVRDEHGVLWLGTPTGLFRDGEPSPPPAPAGCDVDLDCPGYLGGDLCRAQSRCRDGQCVNEPAVSCHTLPAPAPCHAYACVPATGQCEPETVPEGTFCDRVDLCTEPGQCQAGECIAGEPVRCDGATECGPTHCDPVKGCVQEYLPAGAACGLDADDLCVTAGRCTGVAACVAGPARDCDDGDPCTNDSCAPATGCGHAPVTGAVSCDDGDPCTADDACQEGACVGAALTAGSACDDGSGCTTGATCAGGVCGGGAVVAADEPCDDGDPCTLDDTCDGAGGCGGTALVCPDDGNPCTSDACVPGLGCVYAPAAEGATCSHGDACRLDGACVAGWCVGGEPAPDGTACANDDEPCVDGAACQAGACVGGVATSDGATCDDGFACTSADRCEGGFCVGDAAGAGCEGLAACASCESPAGPALLVAWGHVQSGGGGIHVMSLRGALLRAITPPDPLVAGVVHDRVLGDGLWMAGSSTESQRVIAKIGWDGALVAAVAVHANSANWSTVGTLDHVPGVWGGRDVFVQKVGSFQKKVAVIDRLSGDVVLETATFGVGSGVLVTGFAPGAGSPNGVPVYWTSDPGRLLRGALAQEEELPLFPPLPGLRGLARDGSGDFWVVAHAFDSRVARVSPSGQVTRLLPVPFPGLPSGSDGPQAADVSFWPGRAAFPARR